MGPLDGPQSSSSSSIGRLDASLLGAPFSRKEASSSPQSPPLIRTTPCRPTTMSQKTTRRMMRKEEEEEENSRRRRRLGRLGRGQSRRRIRDRERRALRRRARPNRTDRDARDVWEAVRGRRQRILEGLPKHQPSRGEGTTTNRRSFIIIEESTTPLFFSSRLSVSLSLSCISDSISSLFPRVR